nr:unnamed protein product [Digitaria exilis]
MERGRGRAALVFVAQRAAGDGNGELEMRAPPLGWLPLEGPKSRSAWCVKKDAEKRAETVVCRVENRHLADAVLRHEILGRVADSLWPMRSKSAVASLPARNEDADGGEG